MLRFKNKESKSQSKRGNERNKMIGPFHFKATNIINIREESESLVLGCLHILQCWGDPQLNKKTHPPQVWLETKSLYPRIYPKLLNSTDDIKVPSKSACHQTLKKHFEYIKFQVIQLNMLRIIKQLNEEMGVTTSTACYKDQQIAWRNQSPPPYKITFKTSQAPTNKHEEALVVWQIIAFLVIFSHIGWPFSWNHLSYLSIPSAIRDANMDLLLTLWYQTIQLNPLAFICFRIWYSTNNRYEGQMKRIATRTWNIQNDIQIGIWSIQNNMHKDHGFLNLQEHKMQLLRTPCIPQFVKSNATYYTFISLGLSAL